MRVLVSAASRHGATLAIAEAIGEGLRRRGHDVRCIRPERVEDTAEFDAIVLGSAVYAGHWLAPARELVERDGDVLRARQVFLFSSGPVGEPPLPAGEALDVAPLVAATGAREHRIFAGRLVRSRLGFAEQALVTALRAPEGDFRDWQAIEDYAEAIADRLAAHALPVA